MPGLMLNEDDSHFYCCFPSEMLCKEGVDALVDHYDTPQMKELIFNVNAARANYPSKVWQTVWEGFDPSQGLDQPCLVALPAEWRENSFKACEKLMNLDLPLHWIDRVRQRGKSPWLSVRMNDVHDVDRLDLPHSEFWKNHPEYWRVPEPERFTAWTDRAFDYRHKAVRDHFFNLIRELFERYDFDGLELDWMRFQLHFKPGFEEEGRSLLNQFHRDVRALADEHAKRRGHPIKIGVRVPSRPWTARAIGLDAIAWAKEKLVDLIVITPFWATIEPDMPVELWRELLNGTNVILAAGLEINLRPSPQVWPKYGAAFSNTPETVFGAAASLLHRGADRIYLFNYYLMPRDRTAKNCEFDYPAGLKAILDHGGDPAALLAQPRRHVVTFSDTHAPGESETCALPCNCSAKKPAHFRIHIGPRPESGTACVCVGLGEDGNQDTAPLEVRVNETRCPSSTQAVLAPIHPVVQVAKGFEIPPGTLHDGYNYVEVSSPSKQAHQLFWIEIMIRPV